VYDLQAQMIDRRSFMTGSAAAALAAAVWVAPARGSRDALLPRSSIALADRCLAGSASYAAEARAGGLLVLEFDSDVAGVWMRELEPRLRAGPAVFTGRTSAATLFCLEVLARDYGAGCVQRVASPTSVTWLIASNPQRRAALKPVAERRRAHA
jgi:hypothetical protein